MGWFRNGKHEAEAELAEASAAKRAAEAEKREVENRWPAVRAEGAWHRWRRDENHFAENLSKLMKGA
jgi:hypothetical protein